MASYVREVGSVQGIDGLTVRVSVDDGAVVICAPSRVHLNPAQAEAFAQLFVRACWLAGHADA